MEFLNLYFKWKQEVHVSGRQPIDDCFNPYDGIDFIKSVLKDDILGTDEKLELISRFLFGNKNCFEEYVEYLEKRR